MSQYIKHQQHKKRHCLPAFQPDWLFSISMLVRIFIIINHKTNIPHLAKHLCRQKGTAEFDSWEMRHYIVAITKLMVHKFYIVLSIARWLWRTFQLSCRRRWSYGHHHYTSPALCDVFVNDLLLFKQQQLGIHHILYDVLFIGSFKTSLFVQLMFENHYYKPSFKQIKRKASISDIRL